MMSPVVSFEVVRWPLPVRAGDLDWGYGPTLVAVPGTTSVLLTLPGGGPRRWWCLIDMADGRASHGSGMPGHLRAAVFPRPEAQDRRPWVLGTYGLARLQPQDRPSVTGVTRRGLGSYHSTLLDFGGGLLGVGRRRGRSLLLVSRDDGRVVKRMRVPGPALAYPIPGGYVRVLGPRYGQACDLDTAAGTVVARHELPYGVDAYYTGGEVIALIGQRHDLHVVDDAAQARPGGTLVVRVRTPDGWGDQPTDPAADADLGWEVEPTQIAVIDPVTLNVRRTGPAPADAVEILGLDRDGRFVATTRRGLALLDAATLSPIASHAAPWPLAGAALCATANTAAMINDRDPHHITTVRW